MFLVESCERLLVKMLVLIYEYEKSGVLEVIIEGGSVCIYMKVGKVIDVEF